MWQISQELYEWLQERNSELATKEDEKSIRLEEELSFLTIKLEEEGRIKN